MKKRKTTSVRGAIYVADELWLDERFQKMRPAERFLFFAIAAHPERLKILEGDDLREMVAVWRDLIERHIRRNVPDGGIFVASKELFVDYCTNARHAAAEARKRLAAEKRGA